MRISFNSAVELDYTEVGYGHAANNMYRSLLQLGHQVTLENETAPVQIHWKQPHLLQQVNLRNHNVLYFPWESTEFRTGWLDVIESKKVDEVWTTSDWCKKIFINEGVTKPINVYPHGITSVWTPKKRKRSGPLKYLIVDAEANRKGWQEAFDAFRDVFKDDLRKATLTIKTRQKCMARWMDSNRRFRSPNDLPNVNINISRLSNQDMVQLYLNHDVFIGPSAGEGWGFLPFQMLATGGPTIATAEWAHYRDYLGDLALRSNYGHTKWEGEHPGDVCHIDQDHLRELVQLSYDDFDNQSKVSFKNALKLHQEYDWLKLTETAFKDLSKKF